ncbi:SusC/RagA family TonB-linked outer membrane protein [Macellibacteroides fermentans]|uniref:TonB-linked outer membrane protein, SusC/RagA family n=1 Tax=Parabacteroides chartae TaxID=1037355 RepID=A0A1T5DU15_9BACT|nr:TonB-dependent receptor [Parabacteroides chartae]MDT3367476.1 TonB-dependent receptor [Bacteroidota bacterium]SKB75302.1 TonB-linked outer membrane protein, SusC/RagA family [Parabacteroides chartae]HML70848.1 TonB-dependent receptor [Macellibacteroides fermentans]
MKSIYQLTDTSNIKIPIIHFIKKTSLICAFLSVGSLWAMAESEVIDPKNDKTAGKSLAVEQQKQKRITGKVTDSKGEALPFVNVVIKGSTIGTATDLSGNYEIAVNGDVTLIFSQIGLKDYEINTSGKEKINVILIEDNVQLNEVVVVGYNEVERKHVASSIVSVDVDKMKSRPIFKLEEGFSGTIPGATLMQGSNLPGSIPGTISIRGLSTLQNAAPLVIVDGMEQSLTDIDPNQIKSINVLKDAASASMYGSRGANGVIIIETERGSTGEFKVDVHTWMAIQKPIDLPTFVNSADYMRLNNEAKTYQGQTLLYTPDDIAKAERGETANTDWLDAIMQRTAHSYNTSANISGGGGVGTFNLMLGYVQENGLNDLEGTQKFSARFNTNINIADRFVLLADFYAHRLQVDRLQANNDGHGLYQIAWRMNPTQDIYYDSDLPDHYMLHNNMNPVASIEKGGSWKALHDRSTINLRPKYMINENLHIAGNVSYMIDKSANKYKRATFKFFDGDGKPVEIWANSVGAEQGVSVSQITARGLINYEKDLRGEKDKIYLVLGSEIMNYTYTDFREISKASFFSKLNYSFDNRYLLETTLRTDGSSKFAPGNQWGFFPSASLGWNVHNEKFMSALKKKGIIDNMKIRASYGLIGNENVDPYLWQEIVNTWGWTMRVPNPDFSWEKQNQINLGLDLTTLKNRLDITLDVYKKHSYDLIYSDFPVPPLTGSYYLTSSLNIGEVDNKGWELSANWSDKIGDFSYNVKAMLFDNKNEVLKAGYSNSDTLIFKSNTDKIWYKGIPVDNYYGYKSNGFFRDQADVDATNAKLPNTLPGDIKYVDQNGDGVINDQDKVFLGDPFPHYNYSINVDLKYKRWDFSVLGQGVGKRTGRLNGQEGYPVLMDGSSNSLGAPRQEYMDNRWTPENQNSRFPRVWTGSSTNAVLSDVWLSDASFFRIKTIQVGYTIPRIGNHIRNIRIYMNAQDAFTFTKWEGLEPERNGGNGNYPRMASFSLGFKATIL